jgi:hypothetical protein
LDLKTVTWDDWGAVNIQRSNATAVFLNDKAYLAGGIDKKGRILSEIEVKDKGEWTLLSFRLETPLRNAGAIPFNDSFLIFGGSSRPEIAVENQNFAWKINVMTSSSEFFGRVSVNGSFSPYQATIRDNTAAIFSEDGKLYQFDFTKQRFSVPDFIETP